MQGKLGMSGKLKIKKIKPKKRGVIKMLEIFKNIKQLFKKDYGVKMNGKLYAKKITNGGILIDLGLVADQMVTTVGVNYLTDSFMSSTGFPMSAFKWHDSSVGTGAEAVGDTVLSTGRVETRVAGTQTTGSAANIYETVATMTYATAGAITEHGLFSSSAGGTLWDRSLFGVINVSSGDSIQFTYDLTCTAGG